MERNSTYQLLVVPLAVRENMAQLKDLFKRPTRGLPGEPVNDQTVAEKIRKGGPTVPAQADIADLLSYIREGCCFDSESPPTNPRYRGC